MQENQRVGQTVDLTRLEMISTVNEYEMFQLEEGLPAGRHPRFVPGPFVLVTTCCAIGHYMVPFNYIGGTIRAMEKLEKHSTRIRSEDDIFIAVHYARSLMQQLPFSEMDKQKVIVAVLELTRNILDHAGSEGYYCCEMIGSTGIQLTVKDNGKGIDNVNEIIAGENNRKSQGLRIGLAGTKRLMDEFSIITSKEGTQVVATKWKAGTYYRT